MLSINQAYIKHSQLSHVCYTFYPSTHKLICVHGCKLWHVSLFNVFHHPAASSVSKYFPHARCSQTQPQCISLVNNNHLKFLNFTHPVRSCHLPFPAVSNFKFASVSSGSFTYSVVLCHFLVLHLEPNLNLSVSSALQTSLLCKHSINRCNSC